MTHQMVRPGAYLVFKKVSREAGNLTWKLDSESLHTDGFKSASSFSDEEDDHGLNPAKTREPSQNERRSESEILELFNSPSVEDFSSVSTFSDIEDIQMAIGEKPITAR